MRGERVRMLWLNLVDRSLCLIQEYGPNASAQYPESVDKLVMFCEGLKRTNLRYFWESSVHTL